MSISIRVRTYDVVKPAVMPTLASCISETFGQPCDVNIDKAIRPYDVTKAKEYIEEDITKYIELELQQGFVAFVALTIFDEQWIKTLWKTLSEKFPNDPVAIFCFDNKKQTASLVGAHQEQIMQFLTTMSHDMEQSDLDDESDSDDSTNTDTQHTVVDEIAIDTLQGDSVADNHTTIATPTDSVVISFMGDASKYKTITHKNQSGKFVCSTSFSVDYAYQYYKPRLAIVLCTTGVTAFFDQTLRTSMINGGMNHAMYDKVFKKESYVDPADNDMDIWTLVGVFDKLLTTYNISNSEKIILDITHGYRIIPMFVMTLFRYLVVIKGFRSSNITILYANFREWQDPCTVYEVTQFTHMDAWTDAAKAIVKHGNAREMIALLKQYRATLNDENDENKKKLSDLNDALANWVETVQLAQWEYYPSRFESLHNAIQEVSTIGSLAPEVTYVLEWISAQFACVIKYAKRNTPSDELRLQEEIMKWYLDCQMYSQAALLMREYLISKYLITYGTYVRVSKSDVDSSGWTWQKNLLKKGKWKDYFLRQGKTNANAKSNSSMRIVLNTIYSFGEKVEILRNAVAHGTKGGSVTAVDVEKYVNIAIEANITDEQNKKIVSELQKLRF